MTTARLFPVGHMRGAAWRDDQGPLRTVGYLVWLGRAVRNLSFEEFLLWGNAHGVPGRTGGDMTRPGLERISAETGMAGGAAHIDRLLAAGLLVEVGRTPDRQREFAVRHRVLPLLLGLGNSEGDISSYRIGLPSSAVTGVAPAVYEVWGAGLAEHNLWEACKQVSTAADELLAVFIASLHTMLRGNCLYLDVAT